MRLFFLGRQESSLYAGTVDEDKERARQVLRESNSEARTLSDILKNLPNVEVSGQITIARQKLRKKKGSVWVHFGLADPSELENHGVDVSVAKAATKCHVLAIFDGSNTPLHVRVLPREFMDQVDRAIVGDEKFASGAYQIPPEQRIQMIIKNLAK